MDKEITRNYRFDSMAEGGELCLHIPGLSTWGETEWTQTANDLMANRVQRPEFWVLIDYEEWES